MTEFDLSADLPLSRWLVQMGLTGNPFEYWVAEQETDLAAYYMTPPELYIARLCVDLRPWIVFASQGGGKTAVRKMIASSCWPQNRDADTLVIEYERDAFGRALGLAHGSPEQLRPIHCVQTIVQLAIEPLAARKGVRSVEWEKLSTFASEPLHSSLQPSQWLQSLYLVAQERGLERVLCLIDEADEVLPNPDNPGEIASLLKPLLAREVRDGSKLLFRYFLPYIVESELSLEHATLRLDRCKIVRVRWTEQDLTKLLGQRISSASKGVYTSLAELCAAGLNRVIEKEIAHLAAGSPRAAIYLANQLISSHCQGPQTPDFIRPETWEKVQQHWRAKGRRDIFGSEVPERKEKFSVSGEYIYFQGRRVALPGRSHSLLWCLVQAEDELCSYDDLRQAGWPDEAPSGISAKAVRTAVQRMRAQLQSEGINQEWVESVRDRGYRLRTPVQEPDPYVVYETAVDRLLRLLGGNDRDALAYQERLKHCIAMVRRYGDHETRRSELHEVIARLNDLACARLERSFNEICAEVASEMRKISTESL